jgi:hypothetical protein
MNFPDASEISEKLADRAEAVCRAYLPKGRRDGNYWMVGDAVGTPGKSTYVRLRGPLSGKGAAGKWTDAATGDHGNLLDIIRHSQGLTEFRDVIAEACRFLALPDPFPVAPPSRKALKADTDNGREVASRLFTSSRSLVGSMAETYLRERGIALQSDFEALRFHPRCYYGADDNGKPQFWPALIAAVTDFSGNLTGVSRTFLSRDGMMKAPVETQRRAKGDLLGHGIRFGAAQDVMAAGEGVETTLSLRVAMPGLPLIAATGSNHLSAIIFPPTLKTLLVVRDNDHAGDAATDALFSRGQAAGISVVLVEPELDDLNSDLTRLGREHMRILVQRQLPQSLIERFVIA